MAESRAEGTNAEVTPDGVTPMGVDPTPEVASSQEERREELTIEDEGGEAKVSTPSSKSSKSASKSAKSSSKKE